MTRFETVVRGAGVTWMLLVGLMGGAFIVGATLDDPGGGTAVVLTTGWLVPLVALAVLAVRRPVTAEWVYVAATLLVAGFTLADAGLDIIPRDDWGPVTTIAVFALGVALGFLGLRRPATAGLMLVGLAAVQLGAVVLSRIHDEGPRFAVGGSSGAVILPLLVGGVLFLLAGRHTGTSRATVSSHV